MNRVVAVVLACLVAAFPLLVLFGLRLAPGATDVFGRDLSPAHLMGLFFLVIALLRLLALQLGHRLGLLNLALCLVLMLVALHAMLSGRPDWFRFYPVAVNGVFLAVFSWSLYRGMPMVERLARLTEPDLPDVARPYTRKVTVMWCCFFLGNGLVALYTAVWASVETWALYNGVIAYALMALLFTLEWVVRRHYRRGINA